MPTLDPGYAGLLVGILDVMHHAIPLHDSEIPPLEAVCMAVVQTLDCVDPPPDTQLIHEEILRLFRDLLAELVRFRATGVPSDHAIISERLAAVWAAMGLERREGA